MYVLHMHRYTDNGNTHEIFLKITQLLWKAYIEVKHALKSDWFAMFITFSNKKEFKFSTEKQGKPSNKVFFLSLYKLFLSLYGMDY